MSEMKFVKLAEDICKECTSIRQEKVRLVIIENWESCPFKACPFIKERVTARVNPPHVCRVKDGPADCTQDSDDERCPLRKSALYFDGDVIMLEGVNYKRERR